MSEKQIKKKDLTPGKREFQGTVATEVECMGPGLHSGGKRRVLIRPAPAGHGIVFRLADGKSAGVPIPALWNHAKVSPLCTSLASGKNTRLRTIEHLMAALYACGVDNADVEVFGREIPVMDGSSQPFVELLDRAGIRSQDQPRRRFILKKTVEVSEEYRVLKAEPAQRFQLVIRTSTKGFGSMVWKGQMNREIFKKEIAAARTFGRLDHGLMAKFFTALTSSPLCQGAGLSTAVVIHRKKILNPEGLRFPDEFARHRVLDLIGDLMLAGGDLIAKVTAKSPVHRLNRKLLEAIFSDPEAWQEI